MELIFINDTKLKIILNDADMEYYRLDCNCVNYNNTETRRAFWDILDEAKHKTGFDAASDKVFIQLYPSKEGGCEMYVTKLNLPCPPNQKSLQISQPIVAMFKTLKDMIYACRLIKQFSIICNSSAWIDENKICYLLLESDSNSLTSNLSSILNEFGSDISNDNFITYIKEHGKTICENCAVEKLSVF